MKKCREYYAVDSLSIALMTGAWEQADAVTRCFDLIKLCTCFRCFNFQEDAAALYDWAVNGTRLTPAGQLLIASFLSCLMLHLILCLGKEWDHDRCTRKPVG
jgi:hypothetical protein